MFKLKKNRIPVQLYISGMTLLFGFELLRSFKVINMIIAYSGYILLLFSLVFSLYFYRLKLVKKEYALWLLLVFAYMLFMLIHGFILGHTLQMISRDVWPYVYFSGLFVGLRKENWPSLDKMIFLQFLIAVIILVCLWYSNGIAIVREKILRMTIADGVPSISYAWGLLFGWQYMLLTLNEGRILRKTLTVFGVGMFFLFALFFLKRNPFGFLFVIFILVCYRAMPNPLFFCKIKPKKMMQFGLAVILIPPVLFGALRIIDYASQRASVSYMSRFIERFSGGEEGVTMAFETVSKSKRLFRDPRLIVNQAESYQIFFGQGFGSTVYRTTGENTIVESGMLQLFFKGGIFYVILWLYLFASIGIGALTKKRHMISNFEILVIAFIIMSPVSTFFSMYPASGYIMLWLGRCLAYSQKCKEKAEILTMVRPYGH